MALLGALGSVGLVRRWGAGKCQLCASLLTTLLLITLKFTRRFNLFLLFSFVAQTINTATYVIPATFISSELKTWGHGVAASSGKLGAVVGVRLFEASGTTPWDKLIMASISLTIVSVSY